MMLRAVKNSEPRLQPFQLGWLTAGPVARRSLLFELLSQVPAVDEMMIVAFACRSKAL